MGWKIETGVSRRTSSWSCPVANTRTARATIDATNSISALNRSTTSAMPSGAGHPATHSANAPLVCVYQMKVAATATMPVMLTTETRRCSPGRRGSASAIAAPKMASSTGAGMRLIIR